MRKDLLITMVKDALAHGYVSFHRDLLARNIGKLKMQVYKHTDYSAVIGSFNDYFTTSMSLLSNPDIRRSLFEIPERPVFTKVRNSAPTKYVGDPTVTDSLIADGVDAVFTPTDNTIMTAELSIYEKLAAAGIPHYTGADSFALNGAFLGYGVDYANLGVETANMIADILLNGKDPATTPVMMFDNGTATVNTETCEAIGFKYDEIEGLFAPFCTKVQTITTAESFDDLAN
jgi:hypothetical protein